MSLVYKNWKEPHTIKYLQNKFSISIGEMVAAQLFNQVYPGINPITFETNRESISNITERESHDYSQSNPYTTSQPSSPHSSSTILTSTGNFSSPFLYGMSLNSVQINDMPPLLLSNRSHLRAENVSSNNQDFSIDLCISLRTPSRSLIPLIREHYQILGVSEDIIEQAITDIISVSDFQDHETLAKKIIEEIISNISNNGAYLSSDIDNVFQRIIMIELSNNTEILEGSLVMRGTMGYIGDNSL
jgi:hypothetical protein